MSGIIGDVGSKSGVLGGLPWAYVYRTGSLSFTDNTSELVDWNQIEGHGAITANYGWSIPRTGWYRVSLVVAAFGSSNSDITDRSLRLYQGTTADDDETLVWGGYTASQSRTGGDTEYRHVDITGNAIINLTAGKALFAWAVMRGTSPSLYADSGTALNSSGMHINFLGK